MAVNKDVSTLVSSKLHSAEPLAVRSAVEKASTGPSTVANNDSLTSSFDVVKGYNELSMTSGSSGPSESGIDAGHSKQQCADSISCGTNAALNENVLHECIAQTLHRFVELLLIVIIPFWFSMLMQLYLETWLETGLSVVNIGKNQEDIYKCSFSYKKIMDTSN